MVKTHDMTPRIPVVEGADHADPPGVGCPDRKAHARYAIEGHRVGAQLVEAVRVVALQQQVDVELPEKRREAVGILDL